MAAPGAHPDGRRASCSRGLLPRAGRLPAAPAPLRNCVPGLGWSPEHTIEVLAPVLLHCADGSNRTRGKARLPVGAVLACGGTTRQRQGSFQEPQEARYGVCTFLQLL